MKSNLSVWVKASRLRTLPLSLSGIIVSGGLANYYKSFDWVIFVWCIILAILLQIVSNLANDYGDGIKGTDNERIGEKRMIASGQISPKKMKKVIIGLCVLTAVMAESLIVYVFGLDEVLRILIYTLLAIFCIWAAIKYTVGKKAYGYSGLGDIFVFIFFGLVSVVGGFFLHTKFIEVPILFPAISIGLLSVAVLNLNNLRDEINDKNSGKNTIVVKLGQKKAKLYQLIILIIGILSLIIFNISNSLFGAEKFIYLVLLIPIFIHLKKVFKTREQKDFDPELKKIALTTFFISILFSISIIL